MDSRERTFISLNHQVPDRVPIDCWFSPGMKRKIEKESHITYEEFLDKNDVDLRYIKGPKLKDGIDQQFIEKPDMDIWGVSRSEINIRLDYNKDGNYENYREVLSNPMMSFESPSEVYSYNHWPSADWFDYSEIEEQCRKIRDKKRVVVFIGDRLNRMAQLKPAMYLRGYAQILMDLIINPEIAEAIFKQISSFYMEYGRRILEAARGKIDIFCTGDDFGSQNGLLISSSLWNTFFKKGFKDYIDLGKSYDVRVMHHTCGSVHALIPEFIKCKLDILQSIQPEADNMHPGILKKEFGDNLSFQGGISIQTVLPRGSAEDVRQHVKATFQSLAPDGGYIACTSHNIQADTSVSNVEALFRAYHEFGKY